jgi:hypothetical protein
VARDDDENDDEGQAGELHEPRECMACRGTGRVMSNLGGSPSTVECPWCSGGGIRLPEVDAQAHWPVEQPAPAAEGVPESAPPPDPAA